MASITDIQMFWMSFWLYLSAFVLFTGYLAFPSRSLGRIATGVMFLGFLPHTGAILLRWFSSGQVTTAGTYEYANLMSWMAVATFGGIVARYRQVIMGAIVAPAVIIIAVSASMLPQDPAAQMIPLLRGYWLAIHVVLAAIAETAFATAALAAVLFLFRSRPGVEGDRRHSEAHRASLPILDQINRRALVLGYPLFTVGALFAGSIWAHQVWGRFWGSDPKEILALAIWIFYTGLLWGRLAGNWEPRRLAWASVAGFTLLLANLASGWVLPGMHAIR